jgi:hypothetical protein
MSDGSKQVVGLRRLRTGTSFAFVFRVTLEGAAEVQDASLGVVGGSRAGRDVR